MKQIKIRWHFVTKLKNKKWKQKLNRPLFSGIHVLTVFLLSFTETLPDVSIDLRPFGAREDTSLSEFQIELIQLASQLNGDYVLNSYPNIGKSMTVGEANRYAEDAVKRFLEAGKAALKAGANDSAIVTMRPSLTSRVPVEVHHSHLESYWFFSQN